MTRRATGTGSATRSGRAAETDQADEPVRAAETDQATGPSTVDVTVRAIAAGGAGVGDLPDGRVVFVPRTAPGDRARIQIDKSKPRWAVGTLRRLLEPAADRREAPCPLYATCGGCQLQHLPYARQLEWKARFVADALERIAGIPRGLPDIVASPSELRYRGRLTLTLRRLSGGRVVAGFHELARPERIIDVTDECLLPEPPILEAWTALRRGWGPGARLLPEGGRLRLTLRLVGEGVVLLVEGGASRWRADELALAVPEITSIWHRRGDRLRHGADGPRPGGVGSEPALVAGLAEPGSVHAFEQVNRGAADLLRAHTLGLIGPAEHRWRPGEPEGAAGQGRPERVSGQGGSERAASPAGARSRVVDAYCGAGAYGRALAASGWRVTGIELDPAACAVARRDAPEGFHLLEGRAERLLPDALPAEVLLLNPPRAGLHPDVTRAILAEPPARAVYVSCDPATLARDLAALRAAYELRDVRCFDLFPQTAHVEAVAALDRLPSGADTAFGAGATDRR